jgi:hypothetical protein
MDARRTDVSETARSLGGLDSPSYTYACAIDTAVTGASAEEWARATFEEAPTAVRLVIVSGWRLALRLRLLPRTSPSSVLGWRILSSTPPAIVLATDSPLLTARLVVQVDGARVVHTTLVRTERRLGRVVWAAATPIHQLTIPFLLNHAAAERRRVAEDAGTRRSGVRASS